MPGAITGANGNGTYFKTNSKDYKDAAGNKMILVFFYNGLQLGKLTFYH